MDIIELAYAFALPPQATFFPSAFAWQVRPFPVAEFSLATGTAFSYIRLQDSACSVSVAKWVLQLARKSRDD